MCNEFFDCGHVGSVGVGAASTAAAAMIQDKATADAAGFIAT